MIVIDHREEQHGYSQNQLVAKALRIEHKTLDGNCRNSTMLEHSVGLSYYQGSFHQKL